MNVQDNSKLPKYSQEEEINSPDIIEKNEAAEAEIEDTDPPKTGSSGSEEKDITD